MDKQKLLDMVKNQNASYSDKLADLLEKYHSGKLVEWREKSLDFLREALNG